MFPASQARAWTRVQVLPRLHRLTARPSASRQNRLVFADPIESWRLSQNFVRSLISPCLRAGALRLHLVTGTAEDSSRSRACHFALIYDGNAVDQHVVHSLGKLIGIAECGEVADRGGIEDGDVRPHPHAKHAAAFQAQPLRGKRGELANGIRQSELVLFADVLAQDARESAVGAGMRVLPAENSFWRNARRIVINRYPRLLKPQDHIGVVHALNSDAGRSLIFD